MSTSSWTTMGPTRRPSSGGGLRNVHASMSTTRPPTGPGSTWSSGGLPNSPTSKSAAGFTAVSANWRPPSANSSPPTTKPPSLSFGPKPPTKSSPASLAPRHALSPPNPGNLSHEPLGQETRLPGGQIQACAARLPSQFIPTCADSAHWILADTTGVSPPESTSEYWSSAAGEQWRDCCSHSHALQSAATFPDGGDNASPVPGWPTPRESLSPGNQNTAGPDAPAGTPARDRARRLRSRLTQRHHGRAWRACGASHPDPGRCHPHR